jgi:Ca2+ transporting ATPase
MSLKEPLIDKESRNQGFGVECGELSEWFENENRNDDHGNIPDSRTRLHKLGDQAGLLRALDSKLEYGIDDTPSSLEARKAKYGDNHRRQIKTTGICEMIMEQFEDKILRILLAAALVSLVIGIYQEGLEKGWIEGVTIYLAIAIIIIVTVGNDYAKEKQFQKLMEARENQYTTVIRSGKHEHISVFKLLVGDIVQITEGDSLPADIVLLTGTKITTDESNITGEPEHLRKTALVEDEEPNSHSDCFLLAKSTIMSGKGMGVVCAVGISTQQGQAEQKLDIDNEETPLQGKLDKIADLIGWVGIYCATLTFIASITNMIVFKVMNGDELMNMDSVNKLMNAVILSITIVVVAVPEGLPLAVTISLAYSVMKMKEDNNLVRRLDASETMGGANQICSDKTGTLTQNKMSLVELYIENSSQPDIDHCTEETKELLYLSIAFNSTAQLLVDEENNGKEIRQGNQTECGLLDFIRKYDQDYQQIRSNNDEVFSIPFSSKRKRMTTITNSPNGDGKLIVLVKGASEIILSLCSKYITKNGMTSDLDDDKLADVNENVISKFANEAYRTLSIAYKEVSKEEFEKIKSEVTDEDETDLEEFLEKDLTLITICGIQDPLRDGIPQAVGRCKKSGITVRMVTGDNIDTAKAIAKNAGILTEREAQDPYACMEGKQFREEIGGLVEGTDKNGKPYEKVKDEDKFIEIIRQLKVLARSSPQDKYLLVTGLKNQGSVVAVTGDGTNDAPALKKADVGFAMGISGTEVAKEASDIILLDDNFSTIVNAIMWGRNIYASVRKFLQFQLTVNVAAMFIAFIGGVVLGESPLTTIQLLWVNLIMDTFAALALATEPPNVELLEDKPHGRDDNIVTAVMWRNVIGQSVYQIGVLCALLFMGEQILGVTPRDMGEKWTPENGIHYTMIFNTFVMMQVFNEINARKLGEYEYNVFEGFFNNKMFLFIEILTIAVQIGLVEVGGEAVKTSHLTPQQHLV